ncbi:hypothetical protein KVQ01_11245 [Escherichia coli]|uniref:hypothetical protein n=1 Tax=Escherichia coli TaxID=562 RepID=UPI001F0570B1|nr:hypothetical protein [Escherichia coli]MCH0685595.1 hypothetical protein [Escherichia coli]
MTMVKTNFRIGRYELNIVPLMVICLVMLGGSAYQRTEKDSLKAMDLISKVQQENATLTKRIAATELRARDAEKRAYADKGDGKDVNVIIITPDSSQKQKEVPVHSYADLNQLL